MYLIDSVYSLLSRTIDEVDYKDFVDIAKEMVSELKNVDDVDLVVALTHMRVPNDLRLAENVPEIDLILGGHDHHYEVKEVGKTWVSASC